MNGLPFAEEIKRSPINLLRAALYFAREIAYPDLDIATYTQRIDTLAELSLEVLDDRLSPTDQGIVLSEFLFQRLRFRGNGVDYYDPRNSYINEVLERRLGIPISLSLLFLEIARRLEIFSYGVGLPGHFIVAVGSAQQPTYLDPFNGGQLLGTADLSALVQKSTGYTGALMPRWLAPCKPGDILTRMLNNLRSTYLQQEAWYAALAVIEHLQLLQPGNPSHLRDLGTLHRQVGSLQRAVYYYEQYLSRAPEASDTELVRRNLQTTVHKLGRLN